MGGDPPLSPVSGTGQAPGISLGFRSYWARETLPLHRPGHTPLATLRMLAPLSPCERGVAST